MKCGKTDLLLLSLSLLFLHWVVSGESTRANIFKRKPPWSLARPFQFSVRDLSVIRSSQKTGLLYLFLFLLRRQKIIRFVMKRRMGYSSPPSELPLLPNGTRVNNSEKRRMEIRFVPPS